MRSRSRLCTGIIHGVALALLAVPTTAVAAEEPAAPAPQRDFRLSTPKFALGVRGGWVFNRGGSDIFDFVTDDLTLEKSDFSGPAFALDFAVRLADRVDAVFGFETSGRWRRSEFRDYVDQNDIPIVQDTRLSQVPLTISLKYHLTARGRSVGRFAYVPASTVPYLGVGAGMTWYRFEQEGEFVDFTDLAIFEDRFESEGWAPSAHAFLGVDIRINSGLGAVVEARYSWAEADLVGSYLGFDPIDLTGLRTTAGVSWKF